MILYKTENLTYTYPGNTIPAVEKINLQILEGELVLLVGASGCGKSTLLRLFAGLAPSFYGGTISGEIYFKGQGIVQRTKCLAPEAVMLFQDPEKQIVMTEVEREVVFGMENLGVRPEIMKRRFAETMNYMGIRDLNGRKTYELSAGQKQKTALASILAMNPDVLLMDEPTSQMDPISAEELLNTVRKLAEDTGKTIIMAEQKLERCLHLADRIIALKEGRVVFDGTTDGYCRWAQKDDFRFLPPIPKLFSGLNIEQIPVTVKEGRKALASMFSGAAHSLTPSPWGTHRGHTSSMTEPCSCHSPLKQEYQSTDSRVVEEEITTKGINREGPEIQINNLWFSYDKENEILKGISLEVLKGQFVSILGQNGAGKTTLVKTFNGLLKPDRGDIKIQGLSIKKKSIYELAKIIGYLGQNPDNYLLNDTVEQELLYTLKNKQKSWDESTNRLLEKLGLAEFKHVNPRDLSTGQRQRTALMSVLAASPEILILDEPTRGMDYENKKALAWILAKLKEQGMTIILVTHDVEFAAEISDRVVIMSEGAIVADGSKKEVLKNNLFYSPQMNKLFHGFADVITFEEAGKIIDPPILPAEGENSRSL